jgi:ribonuclease HI
MLGRAAATPLCRSGGFLAAMKYYAVRAGRVPGIYLSWDNCKQQVYGFPGALFKSFKTEAEARGFAGLQARGPFDKPVASGSAAAAVEPRAAEPAEPDSKPSFVVEFDGGARGNPGPAGSAAVIRLCKDGVKSSTVARTYDYMGRATNNVAEYEAVLLGLMLIERLRIPPSQISAIQGDSNLVVRQVRGEWNVNEPHLRELCDEVHALLRRLGIPASVMAHIPRAENVEADHWANRAMDSEAGESWKLEAMFPDDESDVHATAGDSARAAGGAAGAGDSARAAGGAAGAGSESSSAGARRPAAAAGRGGDPRCGHNSSGAGSHEAGGGSGGKREGASEGRVEGRGEHLRSRAGGAAGAGSAVVEDSGGSVGAGATSAELLSGSRRRRPDAGRGDGNPAAEDGRGAAGYAAASRHAADRSVHPRHR